MTYEQHHQKPASIFPGEVMIKIRTKHKQSSFQIHSKSCSIIKYTMELFLITNWLNDYIYLISSDQHNPTTTNGLMFTLLDATSAWEVPFGIPQYM